MAADAPDDDAPDAAGPGRTVADLAGWATTGADGGGAHGGVEIRTAEGVAAVRFWGAIDLTVREAAAGSLADLRSADATSMTVDCRDVAFMDSTGLSVLVRVLRDAADDGRRVRFVGASTPVLHLIESTGVDQWMSALGIRADA